jgi:hypothetical protein
MALLWDVAPCNLVETDYILEVLTASIRVPRQNWFKIQTSSTERDILLLNFIFEIILLIEDRNI